jgi:hypothetical protein
MNEKEFVHLQRLSSDYESMKQLTGAMVSWRILSIDHNPPDRYQVTFNILAETVNGVRNEHVMEIDCSSLEYPRRPPALRLTSYTVKHPHVFRDGRICIGGFPIGESLAELCIRMCRFLQYDPTFINPGSIATSEFDYWYQENRSRLPMDRSPLPTIGVNLQVKQIRSSGFQIKQIRRGDR